MTHDQREPVTLHRGDRGEKWGAIGVGGFSGLQAGRGTAGQQFQ